MLDGHLQYAHGAMVGAGGKKPEKSPRPEIKYGQLCRGQAVFNFEWEQYKEEYKKLGR